MVECTLMADGRGASFDDARAHAEKEFMGDRPVEYIIDVKRARLSGIFPLPQRVRGEDGFYIAEDSAPVPESHAAPSGIGVVLDFPDPTDPLQGLAAHFFQHGAQFRLKQNHQQNQPCLEYILQQKLHYI